MLDLLVVIWLMLKWLKILFTALKVWYRQPPRYIRDNKIRSLVVTERKSSATKHTCLSVSKHSKGQVVEATDRDKIVVNKTWNNQDDENLRNDDSHQDFKNWIQGPKDTRSNDTSNKLVIHDDLTSDADYYVNKQVTKKNVNSDNLREGSRLNSNTTNDKEGVHNEVVLGPIYSKEKDTVDINHDFDFEGPVFKGRTSLNGTAFEENGKTDISEEKCEEKSLETVDNIFKLSDFVQGPNLINGRERVTRNKYAELESKNKLQTDMKENIESCTEIEKQNWSKTREKENLVDKGYRSGDLSKKSLLIGDNHLLLNSFSDQEVNVSEVNGYQDEVIKNGDASVAFGSSEQNISFKDSEKSSTQQITYRVNIKELPYKKKIKGHSEVFDVRKEKSADIEATAAIDAIGEELYRIESSSISITPKEKSSVGTDICNMKVETLKNSHLVEDSQVTEGHFMVEHNTKFKHHIDKEVNSSRGTQAVEFMELSISPMKIRKSVVPRVADFLQDEITDTKTFVRDHHREKSADKTVVDDTSYIVSRDIQSAELKTDMVDCRTLSSVEKQSGSYVKSLEMSLVNYAPSNIKGSESVTYQKSASSENVSQNLEAEFSKTDGSQGKVFDATQTHCETTPYTRVAPKLEIVTKTMRRQVVASSLLSRIPFGFTIDSGSPRRRHNSQPFSFQDTKSHTRRSSLDSYDVGYFSHNDSSMHNESKLIQSKTQTLNENYLSSKQPAEDTILEDSTLTAEAHTNGIVEAVTKSDMLVEPLFCDDTTRTVPVHVPSDSLVTSTDSKFMPFRSCLADLEPAFYHADIKCEADRQQRAETLEGDQQVYTISFC